MFLSHLFPCALPQGSDNATKEDNAQELEEIGSDKGAPDIGLERVQTKSISVQFREVLDDPPAKELFTGTLALHWI